MLSAVLMLAFRDGSLSVAVIFVTYEVHTNSRPFLEHNDKFTVEMRASSHRNLNSFLRSSRQALAVQVYVREHLFSVTLVSIVCLLSVVCCLLSVVCCLLSVVCCLLSVVCCLLSVVCCLCVLVSLCPCILVSAVCLMLLIVPQLACFLLQVLLVIFMARCPHRSEPQRAKHNTLESVYLLTSLFVLLSGMTFQSGVAVEGSGSYLLLTYVVAVVLVACVAGFVGMLVLEVLRSIRFARDTSASRRRSRIASLAGYASRRGPPVDSEAAPNQPASGQTTMTCTTVAATGAVDTTSSFTGTGRSGTGTTPDLNRRSSLAPWTWNPITQARNSVRRPSVRTASTPQAPPPPPPPPPLTTPTTTSTLALAAMRTTRIPPGPPRAGAVGLPGPPAPVPVPVGSHGAPRLAVDTAIDSTTVNGSASLSAIAAIKFDSDSELLHRDSSSASASESRSRLSAQLELEEAQAEIARLRAQILQMSESH
jgi:hypothetical protein